MLVLDEQKILSNFIDSLSSNATKQSYLIGIKRFMTFLKIPYYSDLLKVDVYESVKSYILYLRSKGYSTRTIKARVFAIKCFYEMNEIENVKWRKVLKYRGEETPITEDRAYTHEEINQILNVCDLRSKACILLMCSSGMRIGALPTLKLADLGSKLIEGLDQTTATRISQGMTYLTVYSKTNHKYISFITPECRKAIDDYLEYRKRCGEHITSDSPLIRSDFDSNLGRHNVKPATVNSLSKMVWKVLIKSGFREVDHVNVNRRKEIMTNHGFRKFFKTQLVLSKVDADIREMLMGHSKRKLEFVYTKLTNEQLYEEYSKAIDLLTINPENRLKKRLEETEAKVSEMDKLRMQIQEVQKRLGLV